jgi:hypothetical protein
MATIDLLFSFPSESDGLIALSGTPYVTEGENGAAWNQSVVFPGLRLVVTPAAYDEDGNQTQAEVLLNDQFWLLISTVGNAPDASLTDMEACRMVANRELASQGQPFIYSQGLRADPAQIASVTRIDGLPAGSAYPISNPLSMNLELTQAQPQAEE